MLESIECVKKVVECDNGRDEAGYRRLLHDDYVSYVHGKESTVGAEAEVAALASWWKATSDVHLEILEMTESGGLVTLRYTLTGTNDGDLFGRPATGRRFHVENCTLLRVVDGRVQNAYRYSDTLGLMTQLGLMGG
ncbi:MAG: ester cyclase [Spirochaetaceae bacterium]|nr:ester cyclase [Myxococcales bacterium]MCB9724671.1 ester cyclase [Spirochaetaceae bacterium]